MNFTPQQQQAIAARGNVLVMAGAGTGKTRTLVQRCLDILLNEKPPVSLDEILMVTFTEAAAAEMRERIRKEIEKELEKNPASARWHEQLALFDTAHIGTLHSFCFKLVRQHFYELELDPQLTVLPEAEAHLLASETLDSILQRHYAGDDALAEAVQGLIHSQSRGWDQPVRALVLKIHGYAQSLPNPTAWLAEQIRLFESPEPVQWRVWFSEAMIEWKKSSIPFLQAAAAENELAAKALRVLDSVRTGEGVCVAATAFNELLEIPAACPPRKKTALLKPLEEFFADAKFLCSLVATNGGDPLTEDWNWCRSNMLALLRLAEEFSREFAAAKRELGALDFHDLEQHTLRLLWDDTTQQPTVIAREWQKKLRFIFVDEYQDINAAQDKIVEALSVPGNVAVSAASQDADETQLATETVALPGNRFLVGDVKQSIYRFRLANPRIFQNYAAKWHLGEPASPSGHSPTRMPVLPGCVIPLTENFRSREGILHFVNSLFELLMRRDLGGVEYDENAKLRFGAREERRALSATENPEPRVELHLRFTGNVELNGDGDSDIGDLEEANKEARLVALRLRELKEQRHQLWDESVKAFRTAEWRDMAVLLRSPAAKAEIFAKEFAALGVPLVVARGGFFSAMEILDLLSVLQLLDNPLQDVPAIAVLRSPLVGLTLDELAEIRLAAMKVPFWIAVRRWWERELGKHPTSDPTEHATFAKINSFLERFSRWRTLTRQVSLSRCLESVLAETHYAEWLLTQSRGEQRRANVQRLLHLAQQFDQFQRQGLFRFLRFVEAQRDAEVEPEVAAEAEQNSVRLMSIHQSKGLEFPIVAVADLAKRFNESDLRADVILDERYGLCPQIKPPQTGARYPSLPLWLAKRRQRIEMLGEELRLLYVATTRAQDTLILTASISEDTFKSRWNSTDTEVNPRPARCFADWIGKWFAQNPESPLLSHKVWTDADLVLPEKSESRDNDESTFTVDAEAWSKLAERLNWKYPFASATEQAAKVSVTALRREAAASEMAEDEAQILFKSKVQSPKSKVRRDTRASAADVGTAHHRFLQFVSLEQTESVEELKREAERLVRENILLPEEVSALDLDALSAFWNSPFGKKIRGQTRFVQRELEFTARFSIVEIAKITGKSSPSLKDEFIVVQGVADVAVISENEIWIVDFKTDDVRPSDLPEKVKTYAPQLKLYAMALSRIYGKPVKSCWLHFFSARETVEVKTE